MRKISKLAILAALAFVSRAVLASAQTVNFDDPASVQSIVDSLRTDKAPGAQWHPQPGQPQHPGQPNQPGHPGQPNHPWNPGQPNQPWHPGEPNHPWNPGQPNQPWHPGEPNHPWNPGQPNQPWNPGHYDNNNHWHHNPWHSHPVNPQPYPGSYNQTVSFESGDFSYYSDARASMDSAVAALQAARLMVMESRQNGTRYSLRFIAPSYARIEKYVSGQYSYYSDARAGLDQAAAALKADGKVLIESRLNGTMFTISYLDGLYQDNDWKTQRFTFQTGNFSYYSDAKASLDEAVEQLREVGCVIYESRLTGTVYTLIFDGPSSSSVQNYTSGQYSFYSDAKNGMDQAVRSLSSQGNVILEARLNGTQFTISYLSSYYR